MLSCKRMPVVIFKIVPCRMYVHATPKKFLTLRKAFCSYYEYAIAA
jgi:hypothetical protein